MARELNVLPRILLGLGDFKNFGIDIRCQNGFRGLADILGPIAGAAGDFDHYFLGQFRLQPILDPAEVCLPFRLFIDLLILLGPLGVIAGKIRIYCFLIQKNTMRLNDMNIIV